MGAGKQCGLMCIYIFWDIVNNYLNSLLVSRTGQFHHKSLLKTWRPRNILFKLNTLMEKLQIPVEV